MPNHYLWNGPKTLTTKLSLHKGNKSKYYNTIIFLFKKINFGMHMKQY